MNINEILQAIEVYEDNLENKMSVNIINSLMELYQQAIEYFAAIGNPQHEMFLRRMHMLLADENILAVLQGKSQPQNISEKSVISQIIEEKKNDEHQIHESEIISEKVENSTVEKQESPRLRIEKEEEENAKMNYLSEIIENENENVECQEEIVKDAAIILEEKNSRTEEINISMNEDIKDNEKKSEKFVNQELKESSPDIVSKSDNLELFEI